jgi:hypothetical protein
MGKIELGAVLRASVSIFKQLESIWKKIEVMTPLLGFNWPNLIALVIYFQNI